MITQLFMAGLFAYILFKKIVGDRYWALVASVIYLFSSSSVMNMTVGNSCFSFMVFLPLWLFFIYSRRERSFLKNVIFTTITLTLLILSGSWQRIMYTVWFSYLFILCESLSLDQRKIRFDLQPLLTNTLSLFFSLAIGAVRVIPFIMNSKRGITESVSFESAIEYSAMPLTALLRFFAPEFLGMKLHENFLFGDIPNVNHLETFSCYAGVFGSFLFLYVLLFIWDRKALFWKIASTAIILIIIAPPFTFVHYALTGGSALNFGRLAWFIPICVAGLVGIYGSSYMHKREQIKRLRVVVGILFVTVLIILFLHIEHFKKHADVNAEQIDTMRFSLKYFCIMSMLFFSGLVSLRFEVLKYVLLVLIASDLLFVGMIDSRNSNPFLSPAESFSFIEEERHVAESFKKGGRDFRIYPEESIGATTNRCIQLGFYSPAGLDSFCSPYIARIYEGHYDLSKRRSHYAKSKPKIVAAFGLSSTSVLLLPHLIVDAVNAFFVPRVGLYNDYLVIADDRKAFERLTMKGHSPANTVVVDRSPSLHVSNTGAVGNARIIEEDNEHILISTDSANNSILLLTDTYHNGWKAFVDGKEEEILRGNYAFRAVCVPSGKHTVAFSFEHPGLRTAVIISIAGSIAFLSLIILVAFGRSLFGRQKNEIRKVFP
jgi:hypothetical protein